MSRRWRGLTWDHPRGYQALQAAAQRAPLIDWQTHSLEGFESAPIGQLCEDYDLIVLDHPHLGEALVQQCLQPLETVFRPAELDAIAQQSVGRSYASYRMAGQQWALPLDAATQVMAVRPDLLLQAGAAVPTQWQQVLELSGQTGRVALSLAGPHAFLSFLSMCAALDPGLDMQDGAYWYRPDVVLQACRMLQQLAARSPQAVRDKNPIGLLQHMTELRDVLLCPLVFGYVNYTQPQQGTALAFHNAPRAEAAVPGSILGGTGMAVTRRCQVDAPLTEHLLWLLSEFTQSRFIPQHAGQPSHRASWLDEEVNAASGHFYRNTLDTLQVARLRPRNDGFIAVQNQASAWLRDGLNTGVSCETLAEGLSAMCAPRSLHSERTAL